MAEENLRASDFISDCCVFPRARTGGGRTLEDISGHYRQSDITLQSTLDIRT